MNITYKVNPNISPQELFNFYQKNDICEAGYGIDIATRVLKYMSLIVTAYDGEELIGTFMAMFDGVTADVKEFCLAVDYQGATYYDNGSIVEKDQYAIAKELGKLGIKELLNMGAYFISTTVFEEAEGKVYESIGFRKNSGHVNYVIERRPYVPIERHNVLED